MTDVVRGWVCVDPPYTGDDPGDGEGECTLASVDIYITCVEFDDPGGGGGGGDGGRGSGGGGGDDGDGEEEEEEDESTSRHFSLTCGSGPQPRGSYITCEVTTDSLDLDLSQLMFEWSADTGAAHSGTGASSWSGVASHSATIEVTVDNEDRLSRLVDVEARRQNVGIGQLNAQVDYTAEPRRQAIAKLGFYDLDISNYRVRGAQGTGPWEGWFMSHDRALPIVGLDFIGVFHVAEDYKPGGGGPKYSGANS